MTKLRFIIIAIFVFSISVNAQKAGLKFIDKNDLKAYMTFFSSDELRGRETGTPSNDEAALYIKTNIMRLGLKPIPGTGDYYQKIPLVSTVTMNKESYLKISDNNGNTILTADSVVPLMTPSNTMDVSGKVVFAGYGFKDRNSEYDDFGDVDIKDKIVLMMTRNPETVKTDKGNGVFDGEDESSKLGAVFHKGAKAILYVYDPKNKFPDAFASGLAEMTSPDRMSIKNQEVDAAPLQILFITQHTADILLKSTGNSLKQMQEKIDIEGKPFSTEIQGITTSVKTIIETKEFSASNVIGIIEGSDPVLKNECVIYTAHFDHIGVNKDGEVYNGADDNASGSMALLEVAQAFINLKKKPLRTVVFAWVNGEEKGLLGSTYYTKNPVFPIGKTLVDINLDMVGRSKLPSDTGKMFGYDLTVTQPSEILVYTGHESTDLIKMLSSAAKKAGVKVTDKGLDLEFGSSDHVNFLRKGIPAFLFISGVHSDLHTIRDDIEKIDFDKMEKISKMVYLLGYKAANQRDRIKIDKPLDPNDLNISY
ncbi:MAG: M20/M25/M40 family metallo-hydrolase [Bacteroidales bacterium]|nr:M20/M25/M40 family metallo-hydrolase [Bacteroidales bacterium]